MGQLVGAATKKVAVNLAAPGNGPDLVGRADDWVREGKLDDVLIVSEAEGLQKDARSSRQGFPRSSTVWEDVHWQNACDQDGLTSCA